MLDKRIELLADNLINYSLKAKRGEKILIEATDIEPQLINQLVKKLFAIGAYPFVQIFNQSVQREMLIGLDKQYCDLLTKYSRVRMEDMDCYIGIRGGLNSYECSDVPAENNHLYAKLYSHPIHHEIRVGKTRWVVLRYPNNSMAQLSSMSTEAFENLYFDVCNLNYAKMDKAMNPLKKLMDSTDKVRIVGDGTDLSFSIKGIKAVKCSGSHNIPDGEIYSAPIKNSVEGTISYNVPSIYSGIKYENIRLEFSKGKIIKATANYTDKLNALLDTDEGARYIGEFALGVNPYIVSPMGDILFDEKISGSFHFTPGSCYEETDNGNQSAIHWDMVCVQTSEYGGGKIYFDNKLIRENGLFVLPELLPLNPDNLI